MAAICKTPLSKSRMGPIKMPAEMSNSKLKERGRVIAVGLIASLGFFACSKNEPKEVSAIGTVVEVQTGEITASIEQSDIHKANCNSGKSAVSSTGLNSGKLNKTPEAAALANKPLLSDLNWTELEMYASGKDSSGMLVSKLYIDGEAVFVTYASDGENYISGPYLTCVKESDND